MSDEPDDWKTAWAEEERRIETARALGPDAQMDARLPDMHWTDDLQQQWRYWCIDRVWYWRCVAIDGTVVETGSEPVDKEPAGE